MDEMLVISVNHRFGQRPAGSENCYKHDIEPESESR